MADVPLTAAVLDRLADRFKALAERNRLAILSLVREGERTVGDLVDATGLGQANVSKHLAVLRRYGFVQRRKEGLNVYYRLADRNVFRICDLMCGQLALEARELDELLAGQASAGGRI